MNVNFDQHFLKNEKILEKIIAFSKISRDDVIYEIGPGYGILTKKILEFKPKKLICCEIDKSFLENLEEIKENNLENFEFFIQNGLEFIEDIEFDKLIANIPYSITEPLYKKIIENRIEFCILLHGQDFYNNFIKKRSRWYFYIRAFYDFRLIDKVLGDDFEPKTKTVSVLIELKYKSLDKLTKFETFIRFFYLNQKRTLKNNLKYSIVDSLSIGKKESLVLIEELNISKDLLDFRVFQINNLDLVEILDKVSKKIFKD